MGLCTGAGYIKSRNKVKDIFCDECKHYQEETVYDGDFVKDKCFHDKIFKRERYTEGTPITKGFLRKWTYPGNCMELNKNNDCELFEQREWPDRTGG